MDILNVVSGLHITNQTDAGAKDEESIRFLLEK